MKSKIYKHGNRHFRYDYDECMVEYVTRADAKSKLEMKRDDAEWIEKYGHPLWDIDADGYWLVDTIGLKRENWENKTIRNGYLSMWSDELDEENAYMMDEFIKYEMN